jgi:hypothetical protein
VNKDKNSNMSKYISLPLALIFSALLINFKLEAQSIHFNYSDGTSAAYNLIDVRKITFDADLMNLQLWDGSVYSWNVSTIGEYQYTDTTLGVQELLKNANEWNVAIFPNPLSSALYVKYNLPKEDTINIALYDLQGKLILENKIGKQLHGLHEVKLDLTNFPNGTYLCRISAEYQSVTKTIIKN